MTDSKSLPIITINREYGAGGRSVAKQVADHFRIPWYDRDLILKTAEESGISIDDIVENGERLSKGNRIIDMLFSSSSLYNDARDRIFEVERKVIIELSYKPCIIVGRCANAILKSADIPCFRVFLYADEAHKIARAAQLKENGSMDLKRYVAKRDNMRLNYYREYTGKNFMDPHEYDLCLNTSLLGYEMTAKLIEETLENR